MDDKEKLRLWNPQIMHERIVRIEQYLGIPYSNKMATLPKRTKEEEVVNLLEYEGIIVPITEPPWTGHPNRHGPEFDDSPCGSCGHNTTGDMMDSDKCADVGCEGDFEKWIPSPAKLPPKEEVLDEPKVAPAEEPKDHSLPPCCDCGIDESSCSLERLTCEPEDRPPAMGVKE